MSRLGPDRTFIFWCGESEYRSKSCDKYADLHVDDRAKKIAASDSRNGEWIVIERKIGGRIIHPDDPDRGLPLPVEEHVISEEQYQRAKARVERLPEEEREIREAYGNGAWLKSPEAWEAVKYAKRGCKWACPPEEGWTLEMIADKAEERYGFSQVAYSRSGLLKAIRGIVNDLRDNPTQECVYSIYEAKIGRKITLVVHEKYVEYVLSALGDYIFKNIFRSGRPTGESRAIHASRGFAADVAGFYELMERGLGHPEQYGVETILEICLWECSKNHMRWYWAEEEYINKRIREIESLFFNIIYCGLKAWSKRTIRKWTDKEYQIAASSEKIMRREPVEAVDMGPVLVTAAVGSIANGVTEIGRRVEGNGGRRGALPKRYIEGRPLWVRSWEGSACLIISDHLNVDDCLNHNETDIGLLRDAGLMTESTLVKLEIPVDCLTRAIILQSLPSHHMTGDIKAPIAQYYFESMEKYPEYMGFLLHGDPDLTEMVREGRVCALNSPSGESRS